MNIEVRSRAISPEARAAFEEHVRELFPVYEGLRERRGIPPFDLRILLTDDFVGDVQNLRAEHTAPDPEPYAPERVGGLAVGKTYPLAEDYSRVAIVFDSQVWQIRDKEPAGQVLEAYLIAHELAHPVIERGVHASGAKKDSLWPPQTGSEIAQAVTDTLVGEYRAGVVAHRILKEAASFMANGEMLELDFAQVTYDLYAGPLEEAIQKAHPGWANTVLDYRKGSLSLDDMWRETNAAVVGTLVLLTHAQAAADVAGLDQPLKRASVERLPATVLYLGRPWDGFIASLDEELPLPELAEIAGSQERLRNAGERAIRDLWRRLGLTTVDHPDRSLELQVTDPLY